MIWVRSCGAAIDASEMSGSALDGSRRRVWITQLGSYHVDGLHVDGLHVDRRRREQLGVG